MFSDEEAEDMRFLPYLWQLMVIILIGVVVCLLYLPETPPHSMGMDPRERDREIVHEHLPDFHDGHPKIYYPGDMAEPKGIAVIVHGALIKPRSEMTIFFMLDPVIQWHLQNGFMVVITKIPHVPSIPDMKYMDRYIDHKIDRIGKMFALADRIASERGIGIQVFAAAEGGALLMKYAADNPEWFNDRIDRATIFSSAFSAVNVNNMNSALDRGDSGHVYLEGMEERHSMMFSSYGGNITTPTLFFYPFGNSVVMSSFGSIMFNLYLDPDNHTLVTKIDGGLFLHVLPGKWERYVLEHSVDIYPHLRHRLDWISNPRPH